MSLKTFVKVGEITNLSDARYCAGMGVDLLGFNVVENTDGYVDPARFAEITGWVVGVKYCAEIKDHQPSAELLNSLRNAEINIIQSKSAEILGGLDGFERILQSEIDEASDLLRLRDILNSDNQAADYVLVTSENSELYGEIDVILSETVSDKKILKAYDLTENNVAVLNSDIFYGVALKGSEEIKPGYKDFDELAEILEALETD